MCQHQVMLWCTVTLTRWMWQVLTLDAPRMCMSHFIVLASFCSSQCPQILDFSSCRPPSLKKKNKKQSGATHFSVLLWTLSFVVYSFFDLLHLSWRDRSYLDEMVDKTATCSTCGTFLNALQVSWQKQTVSGHTLSEGHYQSNRMGQKSTETTNICRLVFLFIHI